MKINRKKLQSIIKEEITKAMTLKEEDIYGDFGIGGMKSGKPFPKNPMSGTEEDPRVQKMMAKREMYIKSMGEFFEGKKGSPGFETLLQKMGGIKNLGKFIRILAEMKANGDYFVEETPFRVLGKLGLNEEDFYNGPESRILDDLAFGLMN
jgi:hypothetical protein